MKTFTKEQFDFVQEQMTNFSNRCAAVGGREIALAKKVLPALSAATPKEDADDKR